MPWGILYVFLISYLRVLAVPPIHRVPFIRISYFISNGIGSAANITGDTHTYLYFHTRWCWRCAGCGQYPRGHSYVSLLSYPRILVVPPITWGASYVSLISYSRILKVPPLPRVPLIRISTFISENIGGDTNTLALIRMSYFIPEDIDFAANTSSASYIYIYLHSYPRILAVTPTPWGPSYISLISYPRILAVLPISRGPLIRFSYFIPERISGAANTLGDTHTYLYFHSRGYWRCRQYLGAPHSYILFHTRGHCQSCQYLGGPHTSLLFHTQWYWRCG